MPWFACDDCGESIKKPKVAVHLGQCSARSFTCIDCSRTFDRASVKGHTSCVTEDQKYAKGATKPGGFASTGLFKGGTQVLAAPQQQGVTDADAEADKAFLSQRPPWKCSICSVTCTSQSTLEAHAAGTKHRRRVRAATAAAGGGPATPVQPGVAAPPQSAAAEADLQTPAAAVRGGVATATPAGEGLANASRKRKQEAACADNETKKKGKGAEPATAALSGELAGHAITSAADEQPPASPAQDGSGAAAMMKQLKIKKLATKILQASGGRLKMGKLQQKVRAAASFRKDAAADSLIEAKLRNSKQFVCEGKYVSLAS